jgi:hypothetical protein
LSDAVDGSAIYRIGTERRLLVNLDSLHQLRRRRRLPQGLLACLRHAEDDVQVDQIN